jgi:heme/copper-type cytochrome/quinol oxidase subunit 2
MAAVVLVLPLALLPVSGGLEIMLASLLLLLLVLVLPLGLLIVIGVAVWCLLFSRNKVKQGSRAEDCVPETCGFGKRDARGRK